MKVQCNFVNFRGDPCPKFARRNRDGTWGVYSYSIEELPTWDHEEFMRVFRTAEERERWLRTGCIICAEERR